MPPGGMALRQAFHRRRYLQSWRRAGANAGYISRVPAVNQKRVAQATSLCVELA